MDNVETRYFVPHKIFNYIEKKKKKKRVTNISLKSIIKVRRKKPRASFKYQGYKSTKQHASILTSIGNHVTASIHSP